jgi:hypothetical protein
MIVIVPDDHRHKKNNYTFLIYDLSGKLIHESPYNNHLDCEELKGQGRPTFRPYGITSDENFLYISSHKKLGKYNKQTFEFYGLVDIPMYINTHQILKSGETFYITNTSVNSIGIHDKMNSSYFDVSTLQFTYKPETPSSADIDDKMHVNSLFEKDRKIYFCLNNLGKTFSQFGYFDKITYKSKMIAFAGLCCHNIQILNNKLYTLSSGTGDFIEIDLDHGKCNTYKIVNEDKTYLRGMDTLDNKIIFCGSNRYTDGVIPMNNCFVAAFDTVTKTINRQFNINNADIVTSMKVI